MTIIAETLGFFVSLFESVRLARAPWAIEVMHSEAGPLRGAQAGFFLLKRSPEGIQYEYKEDPNGTPRGVVAELSINHQFDELGDLKAHIHQGPIPRELRPADLVLPGAVFVDTQPTSAVIVYLDEAHPELGAVRVTIGRHPDWTRWNSATGGGRVVDLTHHELADLLLDNREDLEEPRLADHLASFRAARTISYDADLGDGAHEGVKVSWKGNGGQQGASSTLPIPRVFRASFPAYTGAWMTGDEPKFDAAFRLRVMPPKGEDASPLFRILWVNKADFELAASRALVERVREVMGEVPTYAGRPSSTHLIIPKEVER